MGDKFIPRQLQDSEFRFLKVRIKGKEPTIDMGKWSESNNFEYNDTELLNHLIADGNYGIIGGFGNLRILDIDDKDLAKELSIRINTFIVKTGSKGMHFYFISDYDENVNLADNKGEYRADRRYVVGATSIHPNGNEYEVIKDLPIMCISKEDLSAIIKPYLRDATPINKLTQSNGKDISGTGLEYRRVIAMIKEGKSRNLIYKELMKYRHWSSAEDCYRDLTYNKAMDFVNEEKKKEEIGDVISSYLDKRDLAQKVLKIQPFFFDTSEIWWLWKFSHHCWKIVDKTDILNMITHKSVEETISTRNKAEILEALRQVGRENKPQEAMKSWIQFKDKIIDIKTGNMFEATSDYFVTNPIAWEIGKKEDTPMMDKLFKEWVGEEYVETLYEIVAYCCLTSMPLHKIFCLIGSGLNGKGTFLRLIEKFVGSGNITSSDFDLLSVNRFESSKLYKKMVCMMGEIDKSIFSKTAWIKRLTGDDLCRVEFKGKNSMDEHLYAKPIIACNTLPETTDKTAGFYRRWLILDFPNRFDEKQNILNTILDEEYRNLAKKIPRILKNLLKNGSFMNEGDIEAKQESYERHSNPLDKFIKEYCSKSSAQDLLFSDFFDEFKEYLQSENVRRQTNREVGKGLKRRDFEMKRLNVDDGFGRATTKHYILGLKWKNDTNLMGQTSL